MVKKLAKNIGNNLHLDFVTKDNTQLRMHDKLKTKDLQMLRDS
ncbi:hypothetical protein TPY_2494 [Sulfobacillus acidophilus TPY]|nr:hypothetical protein TPY_2494 [Sulfobacillus acidophilus TPY]